MSPKKSKGSFRKPGKSPEVHHLNSSDKLKPEKSKKRFTPVKVSHHPYEHHALEQTNHKKPKTPNKPDRHHTPKTKHHVPLKSPISPKKSPSNSSIGISIPRTASMSSLASSYNLSIGCYTTLKPSQSTESQASKHSAITTINKYGDYLYDCVVIYIYCPTHQKFALTEVPEKGLFLPFGYIHTGESWKSAALRLTQKTLQLTKPHEKPIFNDPTMLDILRIQIPVYFDYITRIIYCIELTLEGCKELNLCKDNPLITWCSLQESDIVKKLLGPEPLWFKHNSLLNCREITIMDVLFYLYHPNKNCLVTQLLHETGYTENIVLRLYSDFVQHCYPSEFMTQYSFKSFLHKWKYPLYSKSDQVFHKFTYKGNNYLNFNEFLTGLARIDYSMSSKSNTKKTFLDNFHCDVAPVDYLRSHHCYPNIQFKQFKTNNRAHNAIQAKLKRAKEYCSNCGSKNYTLAVHMVKMSSEGCIYEPVVNKQPDVKRMPKHRHRLSDYYFSKSFVCNQIIDAIRSWAISAKIAKPLYSDSKTSSSKRLSTETFWHKFYQNNEFFGKIIKILTEAKNIFHNSARVIKVTAPCYVIGDIHGNLHDLMTYERIIWKLGPYFHPGHLLFLGDYVDRGDYSVECILYLFCMKLLAPERVFMLRGNHEARAIQLEYTFHNECLMKFGKQRGQEVWEKINEVFDVLPLCAIIDESIFCAHGGIPSGAKKIEEIMAVRSPLQDPDNDPIASEILWNDPVTNQEYQELVKLIKSGINIDNSNTTITDGRKTKISKNTNKSNIEFSGGKHKKTPSSSDVPKSSVSSEHILSRSSSNASPPRSTLSGFLPNTKRGTACYFSEEALNSFLEINGLSHVIRAHEVIPAGYQYHMGGRCITIFSCSNYCGENNEAAVCLVHDSKIRVIKIDTVVRKPH